ncbi:transcription termination factor Rho [bacterium]|nr:transcription termination factor Rho [bacterium]
MSTLVSGVFQRYQKGGGFLRHPSNSYLPTHDDIWVSPPIIRQYRIVEGADICGEAEEGDRGLRLFSVTTINGLSPADFAARPKFEKLTAINPDQRIRLGDSRKASLRIIDLVAPIAKGTRALIVAQPRTGKTTLLEEMAEAIHAAEPDVKLLVLLIDERPEEVTHFRRKVAAEVLASSLDDDMESHVNLVEMVMAQARVDLECGRDVVILMDSLTRMARAYNQTGVSSRKTLSGGLDARALEIPRRFFGMARNVEHGGSITVLATALIDTGSRMDDYIFQEFKGTGNCEIVLDRELADQRLYPAINVTASGTRREELLYSESEIEWINKLRRSLVSTDMKTGIRALKRLVERSKDNDALFAQDLSSFIS